MIVQMKSAGSGEDKIKSGTIPDITTASTEAVINTGIKEIKMFVLFADVNYGYSPSNCAGLILIWYKEAWYNNVGTGSRYTAARPYNSDAVYADHRLIGTITSYGGIVNIDESTGDVTIKTSSNSGFIPLNNIKWYAE